MRLKKEQNWFCRYPYLSNLILFLVTAVFTLFVAELALRFSGKIPGYVSRYSNQAFRPVNQLEVHRSFLTNDEGIFKANPNYEWSEEYQINADGFRSIEFIRYDTTGTKILFLGDSFAWGGSANPITNCFVDIVRRRGYLTFNTGIPGTGPTQYAYIAEKYVPLLKPDIVAVTFYMGNDIKSPDPMLPHKNLFHITNAGWVYAFDENGDYMSPQDAYDYYFAKYNAAYRAAFAKNTQKTLKTTIRRILVKSVIGTYFWVWLSQVKGEVLDFFNQSLTNSSSSNNDCHDLMEEKSDVKNYTRRCLARIKKISQEHGARFMLFIIPAHPGLRNENNSIEDNLHIFEDFAPFIPDFLDRYDYKSLPNDHLNNSGHQKYAEFILRSVESGS